MRLVLFGPLSLLAIAGAASAQTSSPPSPTQAPKVGPVFAQPYDRHGHAPHRAAPQTKAAPAGAQRPETADSTAPSTDAYKTCLEIWDAGTHMSRLEWQRACRRVANRINETTIK